MKEKINVLCMTKDEAIIRGSLANLNMWIMFFASLLVPVSLLHSSSIEILAIVIFAVWQLFFQNIALPKIQQMRKPKITYNTKTKKLKYYHHMFQFDTFTNKSGGVDIYEDEKSIFMNFYSSDGSSVIEVDLKDSAVIQQIIKDWSI